jgi:sigma-E factor negative regulatory protein RseA
MDDEANELELERILSQSGQSDVRSTWSRYHSARAVMRGDAQSAAKGMDISGRVMDALASGQADPKAPAMMWRSALRPLASFAVAASVLSAASYMA